MPFCAAHSTRGDSSNWRSRRCSFLAAAYHPAVCASCSIAPGLSGARPSSWAWPRGVDHHSAIVEALSGKPGPRTTVVAANVSGSRGKRCFQYNEVRFGPKAAQIKRLPGVLLEFALGRSEVKVRIGGNQIAASLPQDIGERHQEFYCFVVGLGLGAVKPCWSLARE